MNQLENHESPARVAPTGRLRRRARCLGLLILSAALLASMAAAALAAKPTRARTEPKATAARRSSAAKRRALPASSWEPMCLPPFV